MSEFLARAEIDKLLRAAILDLEDAAAANRMNYFVARHLGATANALGYPDIVGRVHTLLAMLTAESFLTAAITNIESSQLSTDELNRLRQIESATSFDNRHPVFD